jgi:hypothetical protein
MNVCSRCGLVLSELLLQPDAHALRKLDVDYDCEPAAAPASGTRSARRAASARRCARASRVALVQQLSGALRLSPGATSELQSALDEVSGGTSCAGAPGRALAASCAYVLAKSAALPLSLARVASAAQAESRSVGRCARGVSLRLSQQLQQPQPRIHRPHSDARSRLLACAAPAPLREHSLRLLHLAEQAALACPSSALAAAVLRCASIGGDGMSPEAAAEAVKAEPSAAAVAEAQLRLLLSRLSAALLPSGLGLPPPLRDSQLRFFVHTLLPALSPDALAQALASLPPPAPAKRRGRDARERLLHSALRRIGGVDGATDAAKEAEPATPTAPEHAGRRRGLRPMGGPRGRGVARNPAPRTALKLTGEACHAEEAAALLRRGVPQARRLSLFRGAGPSDAARRACFGMAAWGARAPGWWPRRALRLRRGA